MANIIKSSFTPSTPSTPGVRSSDVFPESQSVRSSDVFPGSQLVTPNQTGIWPSTHPSFSTPYPMEYQTDLASQSAAVRSAQQAAQLMSVPRVQSSSPPSSLPSSSLTLPQSSGLEYPSTTVPSSSLTLQPASSFNPSTTVPSSSLTLPQESTTLPSSSLEYPSQPLSGQPLSSSYILPPPPPPPGSTLTFTSQLPSEDYDDFQELQNLFLPPLQDLNQYDTRYLTQLSPQLDQQVQSVTGRINGMKRKKKSNSRIPK